MTNTELLWFIFTDELVAALLFPINDKYVLESALLLRDNLSHNLAYLCAFLGNFSGAIINYFFALMISNGLNLKFVIDKKITNMMFASLILLPINFFGSLASFLSGIIKLPFKLYAVISLLVLLLYYGILILFI